jgi:hypothetical protein
MESKIKLSQEQAEQLFDEIESEGFGYWVEHYGYDGEEDPELVQLCQQAKAAMKKLNKYIQAIWEHYEIG